MSVIFNQTNKNATDAFATGSNTITDQYIYPAVVSYRNYPNYGTQWDFQNRGVRLSKQPWELGSEILTLDSGFVTDLLGMSTCVLGLYRGQPYGEVSGLQDGVTIGGKDSTGVPTETWLEAHNGFMKLNCVSTMTDTAKTGTLDVNAFFSTMASVYPEIIKPYS